MAQNRLMASQNDNQIEVVLEEEAENSFTQSQATTPAEYNVYTVDDIQSTVKSPQGTTGLKDSQAMNGCRLMPGI